MTDSHDDVERRLKELDLAKREEELRQLKANARINWLTPTVLAGILPLLAGFGLWIVGEMKQYNEAYRALKAKEQLQKDKDALQAQKDSLNIEIATLLQLKDHYAEQAKQLRFEVQARQETMDTTFLGANFNNQELIYSLDILKAFGPGPDTRALEALRAEIGKLPKETADKMSDFIDRYDEMNRMADVSRELAASSQKALDLLPASDWARQLQGMPTGSVIPGRKIMFSQTAEGRRYYDVEAGRFLTREEATQVP